jgi:uncharacterized protein involved in tolerance to divalent cations
MITCRPDISTVTFNCTQKRAASTDIHFQAVKHAIKHLVSTRKVGIYYWWAKPLLDLPDHLIPMCATSLHEVLPENAIHPTHSPMDIHTFVDSNLATCTQMHHSFKGIIIWMAEGTITYKTKLQLMVAQSSMEAEFMVATDASKMFLFI